MISQPPPPPGATTDGDANSAYKPVKLVTVLALGPEWQLSEMKNMAKSDRREIKGDKRQEKWKVWVVRHISKLIPPPMLFPLASMAMVCLPTPLCAPLSYSSDFLETLDEGSFFTTSPAVTPALMSTPVFTQATPYISNPASAAEATSNPPAHPPEAPAEEPALPLLPSATNTEKFLLTAADQESGTHDQRLNRVIRSKCEADLLQSYGYVKGYARLSRTTMFIDN